MNKTHHLFSKFLWLGLTVIALPACLLIESIQPVPTPTALPSPTALPILTSTATLPAATITATLPPSQNTPTLEPTPLAPDVSTLNAPDGGVTIPIPDGGRYIAIGDSLGFGSTFHGNTTYEHMCINRRPFGEQLTIETGIPTTANLDRGNSIRTPFLVQMVGGRRVEYCDPAADDPLLNTIVPGSNTTEWLDELRFHPVVQEALTNPDNSVVLMIIGADIFAEKIGKPAVSIEEYVQNLGKLVQYFATFDKITYVAHFPHVRQGSFIKRGELQPTNEKIDAINQHIDDMINLNGYLDTETGQFVNFGQRILEQDNMRLWINYVQPGPALDQLSDTFPDDYYALDGLHYHAEGYNEIGTAFAEVLKAPIEVVKAEWKP